MHHAGGSTLGQLKDLVVDVLVNRGGAGAPDVSRNLFFLDGDGSVQKIATSP